MKNMFLITSCTLLLMTTATAAPQPETPSILREARGKVQKIDKASKRITLSQATNPTLVLQLDSTTTIFVDGRSTTLDEIQTGNEIRASYEWKEGLNRVQWIELGPHKNSKPSEKL